MTKIKENIQEYYGKELSSSKDLKTTACCDLTTMPNWQKKLLGQIHDEVLEKFYGCGSPIPEAILGKRVLDLGCGSGRDVYMMSKLVGENGEVIGVDMTEDQLSTASKYKEYHAEKYGYGNPNMDFRHGLMEDLKSIGIEDESIDVITSNCVINLSEDKRAVFKEVFRVLKYGGELFFSDVFADRRIPEELFHDRTLAGECLAGALYIEDFRRLLREFGCLDYRILQKSTINIEDEEIKNKLGMVRFYSLTIRVFKLDQHLEDLCEDYGQVATYLGGLEHSPHEFMLDDHHVFVKNKPHLVCGNTAAMLGETRYCDVFRIEGDRSQHFGLFDCSPLSSQNDNSGTEGSCC